MSDESSDSSDYLELSSPGAAAQSDSEGYIWEEDQQNLSFHEAASTPQQQRHIGVFVFGESNHPTAHFPPRHLSSETDYNFLEHQELPPFPPRHLQFEEEEEDQQDISEAVVGVLPL